MTKTASWKDGKQDKQFFMNSIYRQNNFLSTIYATDLASISSNNFFRKGGNRFTSNNFLSSLIFVQRTATQHSQCIGAYEESIDVICSNKIRYFA